MIRVVWSTGALADIDRLVAFLKAKSLLAAADAYDAIIKAVERLPEFPSKGTPALDVSSRHRRLFVPFSSSGYRILYLDADPIEILAVEHMREQYD
jgi:plasmid stabilization system protein ParE